MLPARYIIAALLFLISRDILRCFFGGLMIRLLIAAAFAGLCATGAQAQQPVSNWSGFYIGATVGGGEQRSTTSYSTDPSFVYGTLFMQRALDNGTIASVTKESGSSVLAGLTLGYNWQMANWLVGVEGDISSTSLNVKSSTNPPPAFGFAPMTMTLENRTEWLATLRGRVGLLASPKTLLFVTGGLAAGDVKSTSNMFPNAGTVCAALVICSNGTASETRVGWSVGIGGEYAFAPNWTLKVEYLHYDLGSVSYTANVVPTFAGTAGQPNFIVSTHVYGDIGRVGVNYRF